MSGTSAPQSGAFALNRPRPEIGDGRRAVRVLGIELGQFLLGFALDPLAPFADFIGEALAVFGDVFEDDLVEQDRHGIEVAGKSVRAHAQGFERNRAAAGKRVNDERARAGCAAQRLVRGLGERAAGVEVFRTVELSQLAKSAMKSSSALRSHCDEILSGQAAFEPALTSLVRSPVNNARRQVRCPSMILPAKSIISLRGRFAKCWRAVADPPGRAREPRKSPRGTPPAAAAPTRCAAWRCAHAGWIFSRRACAEMRLIGRSTSMRRLG